MSCCSVVSWYRVLPSANVEGVSEKTLRDILAPYKGRIKYLDVDELARTRQCNTTKARIKGVPVLEVIV